MDKQEPVAWLYTYPNGHKYLSIEREPNFQREQTTETPLYISADRPADDCPSCHGLNISCPEGCGRDSLTGELNGTTLIRPADDGLVGKIEALASEAKGEEGLERVVTLASLGDLVRNNLPAILTALRAQSDAEVERDDLDRP